MDKPAQNIQDAFLNNARKEKSVITIYLLSGVKLSGRIKSFDKYSLVLETNNQEQLIFKHAVSTVVTMKSATLTALLRRASAAADAPRTRAPRPSGIYGGLKSSALQNSTSASARSWWASS